MGLAIGAVLHDVLYVSTVVEITQHSYKKLSISYPFLRNKDNQKNLFLFERSK